MTKMVNLADLVDPSDPQKRSYRQINAAMVHNIPLCTLVELANGCRGFVVHHARDCDQTPLYSIAFDMNASSFKWSNGHSEESLTRVFSCEIDS